MENKKNLSDNIIVYIENPKISTQKLIKNSANLQDRIHDECSKVSCISFYTLAMNNLKKIKKIIPFTIIPKRIKYFKDKFKVV